MTRKWSETSRLYRRTNVIPLIPIAITGPVAVSSKLAAARNGDVDRPWLETSSPITLNLDVHAFEACFHGEDTTLIRDLARSLSI
jgi:hypothetical protein